MIAWKCDLLDGVCDDLYAGRGGSEDCRQDNPSKLSSAFAEYCILTFFALCLQFKQELGE